MMRFALFTLLSTPVFANQIPFEQAKYLKLTDGDPKAAQELAVFCIGKNSTQCLSEFRGNESLKIQAARACVQQSQATVLNLKFSSEIEIPGARAHKVGGTVWHEDYRVDEDGEHRHAFSKDNRNYARSEAEDRQRQKEITAVLANRGSVARTVGKDSGGNITFGTGSISPINVQITLGAGGSDSKTTINGLLGQDAKDRIKAAGDAAYKDPASLSSVQPSILCFMSEKDCLTTDGSKVPNESYEGVNDDKKEDAKDERRGAEGPPKHEEDNIQESPNSISRDSDEMWAGHDTESDPDTAIATPIVEDLSTLSPMETCLIKETKRLTDSLGRMNLNSDSLDTSETEEDAAKKVLKFGLCNEQVMGKVFCLSKKFQEDSVVAIAIQEERREAAKQALEYYKLTGTCDPNALGRDFCKAEKYKWETTPIGRFEIPTEGGRLTKPIKAGDIPKIHH